MQERRNRFIIFDEDITKKSAEPEIIAEPKQENKEDNDYAEQFKNNIEKINSIDIPVKESIFNEEISQNNNDILAEVNLKEDSYEDIGSINKDEDGRIVFDIKEEIIESPKNIEEPQSEILELSETNNDKSEAFQSNRSLQDMINKILKIEQLTPVEVELPNSMSKEEKEKQVQEELLKKQKADQVSKFRQEIYDVIKEDERPVVFKSDLLEKIRNKNEETSSFSILARYGEDYCNKNFVTNPSIGRDDEIKQLILTLLTPEKSAILIGKPGIGKTSIVEGLAFRIQRGLVPEALQGFAIINIKTPSLIGTLPNGETRLQTLVEELKQLDHVILFIDEIHMLIGANNDSAMDFANMFKEGLGRGQIKVIGATTTEEYERYILRDKAFVRRFQSIEVLEPSREHTIKILMGTLPKIEKETGAKMKYTTFIQSEIMAFLTDITSEYKRIYGIGSRYPDICLTLLKEAFSQCIFDNRNKVTIFDVRDAIANSKNIYPDVIRKELPRFDEKFKKIIEEEKADEASIDSL